MAVPVGALTAKRTRARIAAPGERDGRASQSVYWRMPACDVSRRDQHGRCPRVVVSCGARRPKPGSQRTGMPFGKRSMKLCDVGSSDPVGSPAIQLSPGSAITGNRRRPMIHPPTRMTKWVMRGASPKYHLLSGSELFRVAHWKRVSKNELKSLIKRFATREQQ
jgi:hypothetical protein